ncbi:MAG: tetratricopeptide repeat protein [Candidatus Thorarchaeota archaeon]
MPALILNELERGWKLLNEGKEEEALHLVYQIERSEILTPEEKLKTQILKGTLFYLLGDFKESFKISKHAFDESMRLDKPLLSVDAIFIEWVSLALLERPLESWKHIERGKNMLDSAVEESPDAIEQREGLLTYMIGYFYFYESDYDKAIQYLKQGLSILKRYNNLSYVMTHILQVIAGAYLFKGELECALKFYNKAQKAALGDSVLVNFSKGIFFREIGIIYHLQGKLDSAIENFEEGLKIFEGYNFPASKMQLCYIIDELIQIFLEKKSPEQARKYLDYFKQLVEEKKIPEYNFLYRISTARVLKYSSRTRDRAKAEEILKDLILGHQKIKEGVKRGISEELRATLVELCDYYISELRSTNDMGILDDVKPLIERLFKESKRTNSYSLMAQTYLLQGMLSLIQLNMGDARRELSQAQDISESHGLQLLAREISYEHDKLLAQLGDLETLKERKATITERMSLVPLDESIALMQGKRNMNPPRLVDEEPVLLMILAEGGVLLLSYPFKDEWEQNSELFGSFLSAFKSFSNEFFTDGLDRVKFGQYIVLMETAANFSICYLFKGQTYMAKKKLSDFIESIQKNVSIIKTLNKYYQTSQVLELKDFPFLEGFIEGIFVR